MQAQEEFERERQELHEKALEQQKQAVQREEELHDIIKQLKTELAKVELYTYIRCMRQPTPHTPLQMIVCNGLCIMLRS